MLKRVSQAAKQQQQQPAAASASAAAASSSSASPATAEEAGIPNEAAAYLKSLEDPEVIERVRCTIHDAHVFKLPTRQTAGGWRGADWTKEVWQGTLKVVERGDLTVILLVDKSNGSIFAVCPVKDGAVDRCVDSSRYFVLRVENAQGRHMYVGMAFNERNDSFDFNTALEDSRREKEMEATAANLSSNLLDGDGPSKDYSIKEGEKIKISVPKAMSGGGEGSSSKRRASRRASDGAAPTSGGFLKPSSKDTPAGGFLKPSSKDTPRRGPGD
jgi:adaptin ear-binding coat-associated protein 1/2